MRDARREWLAKAHRKWKTSLFVARCQVGTQYSWIHERYRISERATNTHDRGKPAGWPADRPTAAGEASPNHLAFLFPAASSCLLLLEPSGLLLCQTSVPSPFPFPLFIAEHTACIQRLLHPRHRVSTLRAWRTIRIIQKKTRSSESYSLYN